MKRIIVALVLLSSMVLNASAQDTVYSLTLKHSYISNFWPNFNPLSDSLTNLKQAPNTIGYVGHGFQAKDTVTIYGVAVSALTYRFEDYFEYDDNGDLDSSLFFQMTSKIYNKADSADAYEEYGIGLYDVANSNLYPISEMVPLNIFTKPNYYHAIGCYVYSAAINAGEMKAYPVYELYFDEPVKVAGEFFVMKSSRMRTKAVEMGLPQNKLYYSWPSFINKVQTANNNTTLCLDPEITCFTHNIPPENNYSYVCHPDNGGSIIYFFPIIEPDSARHVGNGDDGGDGDSVAVREVNMLQRTVALMPNPASEMVRVVSSSGLSLVEVYNAAGVKVAEQKASGSEAVLDTRGWAKGQYVVLVHTPIGVVSKKLSVLP